MKKNKKLTRKKYQMLSIADAFSEFMSQFGGQDRLMLHELWRHWNIVLGEELAELGFPMGHKDSTLIIGAEDTMAMQELSMQAYEILERVNAFMDKETFTDIQVSLLQNKAPIGTRVLQTPELPKPHKPIPPKNLGQLTSQMDPLSPVGQCYQAYLKFFASNKHK